MRVEPISAALQGVLTFMNQSLNSAPLFETGCLDEVENAAVGPALLNGPTAVDALQTL